MISQWQNMFIRNKPKEHRKSPYYQLVYHSQQNCQVDSFHEYLDSLEVIIETCKNDGKNVIVDDMNCHFGREVGQRCWDTITDNSHLMLRMTQRKCMTIVDLNEKGKGPKYTFFVLGVGRSYIDHCIVSDDLYDKIEICTVIEDSICNTSDHLAIIIKMHITLTKVENNKYLLELHSTNYLMKRFHNCTQFQFKEIL